MNATRAAAALVALLACAAPAAARAREKNLLREFDLGKTEDRIRLAPALGRMKDKKAVDSLLNALDVKRSNPRETSAIVTALGAAGDPRAAAELAASEEYLDALTVELGELPAHLKVLRVTILEAICRVGGEQAVALATKSLDDKDPLMIEEAVRGLGRLQVKDAVPALLQRAESGGDMTQAAFEALAAIGDKRALPALEKSLESLDKFIAVEAAYALAKFGRRDMNARLKAALKDGPEDVKPGLLAAYYLAKLDDAAGLDFLVALMKKPDSGFAAYAAEALGKSENPRAVLPLVEAAKSDDSTLRLSAARSLGRFDGARSLSALKILKDDPNPGVRNAALSSLAGLGEIE